MNWQLAPLLLLALTSCTRDPGPKTQDDAMAAPSASRVEAAPPPRRERSASVKVWETLSKMSPGNKTPPEDVAKLIGTTLRVAGFVIVNDSGSAKEIQEFLITPVSGGCVHVPPPPPNYILHVIMAKGKKAELPYGPVVVSGKLGFPKKASDRQYYSFELVAQTVEDFYKAEKVEN